MLQASRELNKVSGAVKATRLRGRNDDQFRGGVNGPDHKKIMGAVTVEDDGGYRLIRWGLGSCGPISETFDKIEDFLESGVKDIRA